MIELRETAKPSKIYNIQSFQSKALQKIVDVQYYMSYKVVQCKGYRYYDGIVKKLQPDYDL